MMNEKAYTKRVMWLVLIGAALLFIVLLTAWISEGVNKEWRKAQKAYARILTDLTEGEATNNLDAFERGIFQLELPALDRKDRCISCHNGLEDPRMEKAAQPHRSHPGTFLSQHPLQDYGCTICHGGQGAALSSVDAHGRDAESHWEYPMLEQPYIQSSCGKCHLAIFEQEGVETKKTMKGMDFFYQGKELFSAEGCLGCHQARGVGGILGPDLTEQGEKTKHEYSFQNIQGEQSVSNWLKEHFRDPEMVSPGSQMLKIDLGETEMDALATFVMGLARPEIEFSYFSMATLQEFKGQRPMLKGKTAFAYLCSACHGKAGEGKDYETFQTGVPSLGNPDFLRVASPEYIRFTLEKGRSLRQMGSWVSRISGLHPEELDSLTRVLDPDTDMQGIDRFSSGDWSSGMEHYEQYCQACHGEEGQGGVALALNQDGLLVRADKSFIFKTLLQGRRNTAMPGWSILEDGELEDLYALLIHWRKASPLSSVINLAPGNADAGSLRYHFLCSRCHGSYGEGETGPAIINKDFLDAASDTYLYRTIAEGREHTAMFGWMTDVYNQERLLVQDLSNIIAFLRVSARDSLTYIHAGSNPGQAEEGMILFERFCSSCHGKEGEGLKAPALNNQELLSAASNGYLLATLTVGRQGTAMPSWGYGQAEYPALSGDQRHDLVAFIRSWERIRIKY